LSESVAPSSATYLFIAIFPLCFPNILSMNARWNFSKSAYCSSSPVCCLCGSCVCLHFPVVRVKSPQHKGEEHFIMSSSIEPVDVTIARTFFSRQSCAIISRKPDETIFEVKVRKISAFSPACAPPLLPLLRGAMPGSPWTNSPQEGRIRSFRREVRPAD